MSLNTEPFSFSFYLDDICLWHRHTRTLDDLKVSCQSSDSLTNAFSGVTWTFQLDKGDLVPTGDIWAMTGDENGNANANCNTQGKWQ